MADALDLVEAIKVEIQDARNDVSTWGLTETGVRRVHSLLDRFELALAEDVAAYKAYQKDVSGSLMARLHNVRDLKRAVLHEIADAREAGWLDSWITENENEPESGLTPSMETPSRGRKSWVN